jgi:hypothetical protein
MTSAVRRLLLALRAGAPLSVVAGLACTTDAFVPPEAKGFSAAYGLWTPRPGDTCTVRPARADRAVPGLHPAGHRADRQRSEQHLSVGARHRPEPAVFGAGSALA